LAGERILLIDNQPEHIESLLTEVLAPCGYLVQIATSPGAGLQAAQEKRPDLVLFDLSLRNGSGVELIQELQALADLPVILLVPHGKEREALRALRMGARDALMTPLDTQEASESIARVLHQDRLSGERDGLLRRMAAANEELDQALIEVKTLCDVGKTVAASLQLQDVLVAVVQAAVNLTAAQEGYLLLRDEANNELYLRAAQNLGESHAREFRVRVDDSIAGHVVRTGESILLSSQNDASIKVKTGYLVQDLINVPLKSQAHIIGVLGIDNMTAGRSFTQRDVMLLSALADFAAIAVHNAQIYTHADQTLGQTLTEMAAVQEKTTFILHNIAEGVFTVDKSLTITSVNPAMERITGWPEGALVGQRYDQIFAPQIDDRPLAPEHTLPGQVLLSGKSIISSQCTILHQDGHRVPVAGTAVHLRAADASITGVLVTMRDLTLEIKQRRMQREFAALVDQWVLGPFDHTPPDCHPITLRPIIDQVIRHFQRITSGGCFRVKLAADLPFAVGDPQKLETALGDFIENSLVVGNPQQPIEISAHHADGRVIVAVEGTPLSATGWPSTEFKLHIAKRLVQAQGGDAWIETRAGPATRFCFSLPTVEVAHDILALVD